MEPKLRMNIHKRKINYWPSVPPAPLTSLARSCPVRTGTCPSTRGTTGPRVPLQARDRAHMT